MGLIPSQQPEDVHVSNFKIDVPSNRVLRASVLKSKLEESTFAKYFLLFATMLGTSMVICDGILTPCISGLIRYCICQIWFLLLLTIVDFVRRFRVRNLGI